LNIFHLSAECYPAAKVGGLADVVGSLPKYLRGQGVEASVIIPKYGTEWIKNQKFESVFSGKVGLDDSTFSYSVEKEVGDSLGFPLYVAAIPKLFERAGIYGDPESSWGYEDEADRFFSFQIAALKWINSLANKPDVIHCHDHHTALIPFMMTQCGRFKTLKKIPTVVTVHNAEYQGSYSHEKQKLLPDFDELKVSLLDWGGRLNSLAAGLKCCEQITTVSPSYMKELRHNSSGLESLFAVKQNKSRGILNGIDESVWNPQTDRYLEHHYVVESISEGKKANKEVLCDEFNFDSERPLISFIGRLVAEKGADLLPDLFASVLKSDKNVSFLVLGTGFPELHERFEKMSGEFVGFFDASLHYNEKLAHQIYAGSDFMIMPSRVEPCGLNQMYAMRYGTIPIVREVGGLKDTVHDISEAGGCGITFQEFTLEDARQALGRALKLYGTKKEFYDLRKKNMMLDYSWNASAKKYIKMYSQLIKESL